MDLSEDVVSDDSAVPAEFTYSVKWRESDIPYEKRMDKYRRYSFLPQHLEVSCVLCRPLTLQWTQDAVRPCVQDPWIVQHVKHHTSCTRQYALWAPLPLREGPDALEACIPILHWPSSFRHLTSGIKLGAYLGNIQRLT